MKAQDIVELKLKPALEECAMHRQRLHQAWLEAREFAPLRQPDAVELDDAQVRTLDQLVFRFGRLQDAMGVRLLPNAEQWQLLRELRNQTAQEYPAQPELARANLRRLVEHVPVLEQAHEQMATAARQRIPS